MRSRWGAYRLYRAALHLYPKNYRQEYGGQMVQTLEDMLDDARDSADRATIWLRIVAEMPLSIIKENSNNIGEKSMNKLATISNKRLRIGGIAIAIIVLVAALGIWRNYVVSGVATMMYTSSLRSTTMSQKSKLAEPFAQLMGSDPKLTSSCPVWQAGAMNIQMQVECGAALQTYTKLGQSAADKAKVLASVDAITAALKAEGYQGGSNGVTLKSLVAGTYEGKDYSPDAFYQKTVGKDVCTFDVTVAYSNPATPAIHMSLNCNRTLYPFGKPYQQFGVRG